MAPAAARHRAAVVAPPSAPTKVWYASERKYRSRWKFFVFEDRGTLEIAPGRLIFQGRNRTLALGDVQSLELVPTVFATYATLASFAFALAAVAALGAVSGFALSMVGPGIIGLVAGLIVGPIVARRQKWIRVTHAEVDGSRGTAYFAASRGLGWGSMLGGTQEILRRIEGSLAIRRPAKPPTYAPAPR